MMMHRRSFLGFLALAPAVPDLARAGLRAIEEARPRWTSRTIGEFAGVAEVGGRYVAVSATRDVIAISEDGVRWTFRTRLEVFEAGDWIEIAGERCRVASIVERWPT